MNNPNEFAIRLAQKQRDEANKKILEIGLKEENVPMLKNLFKQYYQANQELKKYNM
jgi:hypothetical protein